MSSVKFKRQCNILIALNIVLVIASHFNKMVVMVAMRADSFIIFFIIISLKKLRFRMHINKIDVLSRNYSNVTDICS